LQPQQACVVRCHQVGDGCVIQRRGRAGVLTGNSRGQQHFEVHATVFSTMLASLFKAWPARRRPSFWRRSSMTPPVRVATSRCSGVRQLFSVAEHRQVEEYQRIEAGAML